MSVNAAPTATDLATGSAMLPVLVMTTLLSILNARQVCVRLANITRPLAEEYLPDGLAFADLTGRHDQNLPGAEPANEVALTLTIDALEHVRQRYDRSLRAEQWRPIAAAVVVAHDEPPWIVVT
jgi:hypothetical protein